MTDNHYEMIRAEMVARMGAAMQRVDRAMKKLRTEQGCLEDAVEHGNYSYIQHHNRLAEIGTELIAATQVVDALKALIADTDEYLAR